MPSFHSRQKSGLVNSRLIRHLRSATSLGRTAFASGLISVGLNLFSPGLLHAGEQYWDGDNVGGGAVPNNAVDGGSGSWNSSSWVDSGGTTAGAGWVDGSTAVFTGASGNVGVNILSTQEIGGLTFKTDNYVLGGLGALELSKTETLVTADAAVNAVINTQIKGGNNAQFVKDGLGTVTLTNTGNNYTGGTEVRAGTLKLQGSSQFGNGPLGSINGFTSVTGVRWTLGQQRSGKRLWT